MAFACDLIVCAVAPDQCLEFLECYTQYIFNMFMLSSNDNENFFSKLGKRNSLPSR